MLSRLRTWNKESLRRYAEADARMATKFVRDCECGLTHDAYVAKCPVTGASLKFVATRLVAPASFINQPTGT